MKKYLVTGGAGFIGSHIVETLVTGNNFVRVLDNLSAGKMENLKNVSSKIEFIKGDIRSKPACDKACRGIDFILHQAALRNVAVSMSQPEIYNEVNVQGTVNLLRSAVENKARLFVLASSSSIYGDTPAVLQKEGQLPQPISPYALTKLTGEHYCRIFSVNFGLPTVALRYFNVYGPRQSLESQYSSVVPTFIKHMLFDKPAPVNGTGKQSRDLIYVADIVKANILATKKAGILRGDIINIADGRGYSVLDIVRKLNKIMGKNIRPVFLSPRPGDVQRTLADITQAGKKLRFKPDISFDKGLEFTLEYFKEKWRKERL